MISKNIYIPTFLSCCNLIAGCFANAYAFNGDIKTAFLFVLLGALFNFLDGIVARFLIASTPIGKELDSLADNVTFGMVPSMMVFYELHQLNCPEILEPIENILPYTAFLIAAFSALRLAKFNIDTCQKSTFIGLPTPANALFWGGLLILQSDYKDTEAFYVMIIILVFLSSYLLFSKIPMPSLKFKKLNWKENRFSLFFLATAVILLLILSLPAFAIIICWYVILSWIKK